MFWFNFINWKSWWCSGYKLDKREHHRKEFVGFRFSVSNKKFLTIFFAPNIYFISLPTNWHDWLRTRGKRATPAGYMIWRRIKQENKIYLQDWITSQYSHALVPYHYTMLLSDQTLSFNRFTCPEKAMFLLVLFKRFFFFFANLRRNKGFKLAELHFFFLSY